jgi:tetratricopeptide (TPR) repeat protein
MAVTLQRFSLRFGVMALTFALVILAVTLVDGSGSSAPTKSIRLSSALPQEATTDDQIAALRADIANAPSDVDLRTELGLAYLTKSGEVADSRFYLPSDQALSSALRLDPDNFAANSATGKLALARHDFRRGLLYGKRAQAINSSIASNYGIVTDAHIELGQYGAAERTLQRWVNLKPGLAPYARVSYFRELHGDLAGAIAAMKLAADASGSDDFAFAQSLVGKLEFDRGRYAAAESAYRQVLAVDPAYPAALGGLGAIAAARGNFDMALRQYQAAAQAQPVAHEQAAERAYARTEFLIERERPNGTDVRAELALFEAEHGSPMRAVALARASLPDRPSVVGYDALAWSLHHAGMDAQALAASKQAMKLGSRDPLFLYRAGMISAAAGADERAKQLLGTLLEQSPRFHPIYAPQAQRALDDLG